MNYDVSMSNVSDEKCKVTTIIRMKKIPVQSLPHAMTEIQVYCFLCLKEESTIVDVSTFLTYD